MGLTRYKIGEFVSTYNVKCGIPDLTENDISGVNREKELFAPSHQVGSNTSSYKVVPPGYFACNLMHVGRDKVLPIAMNHSEVNCIVSPAYTIFSFDGKDALLPDYFFIYLKSEERDRCFWFHTDASVRDGMSWDDFCDLEIEVPSTDIQQKFVDIYNAMVANQKCYEESLEDLKLACDAELEKLKAESIPRVALGKLFDVVDERNSHGECISAMGINISKSFMESKASTGELKNCKLVKPGQFAFSGMQTGRDKCIRIALYDQEGQIAISPAYTVLESINDAVDSNYLMMLFEREESDRLGWFLSDSSIRSNLDLDRFFEIKVPIPNESIMKSLGNMRKVLRERILINERMKTQIKDICPILIKGSLEEASKA